MEGVDDTEAEPCIESVLAVMVEDVEGCDEGSRVDVGEADFVDVGDCE